MISFLTPFLSGRRMLKAHLLSIRKYYPDAEIIISAFEKGAEDIADEYNARYSVDGLGYHEAVQLMLTKSSNDMVVICDHDTLLLDNIDYLAEDIRANKYNLVGVEERIRHPEKDKWERYAPGYMDMSFFMFDKKYFQTYKRYPEYPKYDTRHQETHPERISTETHYGLCEYFDKHKYLRPYYTKKYGLGNLLMDDGRPIAWHQWFGAYEKRQVISERDRYDNPYKTQWDLIDAETRLLNDYPSLDLSELRQAYAD